MNINLVDLEFINPLLREMTLDLENEFGVTFTITSLVRIGDEGVHGTLPLRGIDLRCRNASFGLILETYVNQHWWYNSRNSKKCAIYYPGDREPKHLHLQVHPNTKRRDSQSGSAKP